MPGSRGWCLGYGLRGGGTEKVAEVTVVGIGRWCSFVMLDIIGSSGFGYEFRALQSLPLKRTRSIAHAAFSMRHVTAQIIDAKKSALDISPENSESKDILSVMPNRTPTRARTGNLACATK